MSINLIPQKVQKARRESFWKRTSLWGSIAVVVAVGAVSVGVLLFRFFLQRELARLSEDIEAERQKIRAQRDVELKLRDLEKRADSAVEILDKRIYYSRLLSKVAELLPREVTFSRLRTSSPDAASLSGTASSYIDLARFIGAVQEDQVMMSGIQLRSANLDAQTGNVGFDLDLEISKEALYGD